ncbi:DUF6461 domain-containing protein [Streptomyces sp. NPDC093064]|uniref:DUF6461 domain-containing protein n=1 Tax=Streptomyces sp. NPDC093064 TaxID=3366020 RepID=UPI0037F87276
MAATPSPRSSTRAAGRGPTRVEGQAPPRLLVRDGPGAPGQPRVPRSGTARGLVSDGGAGYIGTLDGVLSRLSAGRTAVSHFRNVNAVDHFNWFENAELRLHFEPLFAHYRDGSDPDSLVTPMREVGLAVEEGGADDLDMVTAATFALAERVTGIRLTPEFLENTLFIEGVVPIPRG